MFLLSKVVFEIDEGNVNKTPVCNTGCVCVREMLGGRLSISNLSDRSS